MVKYNSYTNPIRHNKENTPITVGIITSRFYNGVKSYGNLSLCKNLNGTTLLEHQIKIIEQSLPHAEIIVVTGWDSERLHNRRSSKYRIVDNQLYNTTNECEDVRLLFNNMSTNNLLLINGNIVFDKTSIAYNGKSYILHNDINNKDVGTIIADGHVTHLNYNTCGNFEDICWITGQELSILKKMVVNKFQSKLMLFELLNEMIDNGANFQASNPSGHKTLKLDNSDNIHYYITQSIL